MSRIFIAGVGLIGLLSGCDAAFEDLRPGSIALSQDAGIEGGGGADLASLDLGGGPDGGSSPDLAALPDQGASVDVVRLVSGRFVRLDYEISGTAEVFRLPDGTFELRLSDDFSSFPVPGPVIVFATRDRIGARIDPSQGDIRIGALLANRGAQTYAVPEAAASAPFVFIYCEPFGLEVGVAALTPGG